MSDSQARLTIGNKTYDFDIIPGTIGPSVVDINTFYGDTGMFTYDPGYTSTGSCAVSYTHLTLPTTPYV